MEKPTIMIAGAGGFVGTRAMAFFSGAIPVPSALLRHAGEPLCDFIQAHHPDIIINAAAISDIGTCEQHPEDSYRANVLLPVTLAKAAAEIGAKLVSFSTDQVYTGCTDEGPYEERDSLSEPANVYARHKLEAEERVLEISPDSVLLRATWMYDMPLYGAANRGNFFVNTLNAALHGREITASSGEHRGITYVRQMVELLESATRLSGGVYNFGSENPLNMLDTTKTLLTALGLGNTVSDTPPRRHPLWMDCSKLKKSGIIFDTTAAGFSRCLTDYGLNQ